MDKVFPKSDRVEHKKVSFQNRYGSAVSADIYLPKDIDRSQRHPALVVGHPYGGTKEQTSGLYAQTMAERGFVTIAHDASYNGESGGEPRAISSAEIWVEDYSAASTTSASSLLSTGDVSGSLASAEVVVSGWLRQPLILVSRPSRRS